MDSNQPAENISSAPMIPTADEEDEKADWLAEISRDFHRLQMQKSRKTGGVEARILTATAFKWGEHFVSQQARGLVIEPLDPNKLYLVFNLIEGAYSKLSGRLTSIGGSYYSRPDKKDPAAAKDAEVVDRLILALDEKLDQDSRTWEIIDHLLVDGVAFEYVPWIPNSTIEPVPQFDDANKLLFTDNETKEIVNEDMRAQAVAMGIAPERYTIYEDIETVGDVGSEIFGGLQVFIDQSVKSVGDLAPDQAVYIAKIRTLGWIEETYGPLPEDIELERDLKIVTTQFFQEGDASASLFLKDLIPCVQGTLAPDDPEMAVVVERYQPTSQKRPHGRFTCFIPAKHVLYDGDNPYEEIPLVDFHFKPVTSTFWTKDYITDLIAPQKFLNKRISQLGEQSNASIYDKILLGGTLSTKDIVPDKPGVIEKAYSDSGQPLVSRLAGPQLPQWFLESINLVAKMFQQIAGGSDLMEDNRFPGQLRGPMAVPMLQEIMDTEWGMLYRHIGQRMAKVKQMRLNRVKQFYPPIRTLHYTDKDQRDEVMSFHAEKVLRSGTNFNVTVERGSLLPELRALNESKIRERLQSPLAILYTDDRTGRLDKSKIAQDLKMGDFGREGKEAQSRTFAKEIIEQLWQGHGMPPVMPFWDHEPMMDEIESAMMTTEFLSSSMPVQQLFMDRWTQHSTFLQQRAQMQAEAANNGAIQNAVAQATQQAAAVTAGETVKATISQVHASQAAGVAPQAMLRSQIQGNAQPPQQSGPGGGTYPRPPQAKPGGGR